MKKLEDLPRKNIFETPEGYFDQLPATIQMRITSKDNALPAASWSFTLKYAIPVLILTGIGIFWYNSTTTLSTEEELQAMNPDQLGLYLNETDMSTEELIETVTWSSIDLEELENEVYSNLPAPPTDQEIESVLEDYESQL